MKIEEDVKLDFCDVLIKPKRSQAPSRSKILLERTYKFKRSSFSWTGIPIIASNMDTVGTIPMANALSKFGLMTCLHKFIPVDDLYRFFAETEKDEERIAAAYHTFYTMGITDEDVAKLKKLLELGCPPVKVCIDVANGYTEYFQDKVKEIRERYLPHAIIMAGNVATPEMVQELIISGTVDIVKVGIGPGSVCTTRKATGVGYPQLSAVIECADAAHGLGGYICADGGCVTTGDICKAFGAGADFVMIGGMLAGHEECLDRWHYTKEGKKYMRFYGMSSQEAMEKYMNGKAAYRAAEGKTVEIDYRGPVLPAVEEILGGLRSACAYIGAMRLKDFSKCCTFVKVNRTHNVSFGD